MFYKKIIKNIIKFWFFVCTNVNFEFDFCSNKNDNI